MSESSAATLDTLQLKVIELAHRRATLRESGQAYCKLDGEPWPCNVQRLIASVRAARLAQQQAEALMAAAREYAEAHRNLKQANDARKPPTVTDEYEDVLEAYDNACTGLHAAARRVDAAERDASKETQGE